LLLRLDKVLHARTAKDALPRECSTRPGQIKKQPEAALLHSLPVKAKASIAGRPSEQCIYGTEIPETQRYKIKDFLMEIND